MSLTTEIKVKDSAIVCYIEGRIIYETESILKAAFDEILSGITKPLIIINCQGLSYINSSGIGLLVRILKDVRGSGRSLCLCNLQPSINDVFRVTNLNQVFRIFPTEEEAINSQI
ncbi:MAG: STAS domain-containing protein [Candidatus Wallbacteria bacterium]|nr:STAS domain-containing protein [Candidatus Wallbacteria bacterium]